MGFGPRTFENAEFAARRVDLAATPREVGRRLAREEGAFLLESALPSQEDGAWSFLSAWPEEILEADLGGEPLERLRQALDRTRAREPAPLPFAGGWVGWLSYDLGREVERLPVLAARDVDLPVLRLSRYEAVLAHDGRSGQWMAAGRSPDAALRLVRAAQGPVPGVAAAPRAGSFQSNICLRREIPRAPGASMTPETGRGGFRSGMSEEEYQARVARVIEYIRAGDVFQVNLSQRFEAPAQGDPFDLYCAVQEAAPAPFAAFLPFPEGAVIGASPERFLTVRREGDAFSVSSRPIKGTRPRGSSEASDRDLAQALVSSQKDRAELAMIVDLVRNDLGRVATVGSVRVPEDRALRTYPTVHHLVSTVTCRLRPELDRVDLLRATFPGGSVTGAPKVRAMEIIEELEPVRRAIYTGAVGYFGFDGQMDLNLAIRTALYLDGTLHVQVGGGIVIASDPSAEYQETLDKAAGFFRAWGDPQNPSRARERAR